MARGRCICHVCRFIHAGRRYARFSLAPPECRCVHRGVFGEATSVQITFMHGGVSADAGRKFPPLPALNYSKRYRLIPATQSRRCRPPDFDGYRRYLLNTIPPILLNEIPRDVGQTGAARAGGSANDVDKFNRRTRREKRRLGSSWASTGNKCPG